jgi:hypothetical protein
MKLHPSAEKLSREIAKRERAKSKAEKRGKRRRLAKVSGKVHFVA